MAHIQFEATPNPSTMKFKVGFEIPLAPLEVSDVTHAQSSPLALKLFGFPWMSKVYIGADFISITKQDWVDWDVLAQPLANLISEHIQHGEAILLELPGAEISPEADTADGHPGESSGAQGRRGHKTNFDLSTIEGRIQQLLHREIQPAVALDGGEIRYVKFENGILYIQMRGACSGCPSASFTLKEGIETRVCEVFPEVREVVALPS